jgi:transposase
MTGTRWNACGSRHAANAPPGLRAPGTVTYGLNVQAWHVSLLVMHHVPVERCAGILESMSGARPSDGCYAHPGLPATAGEAPDGG